MNRVIVRFVLFVTIAGTILPGCQLISIQQGQTEPVIKTTQVATKPPEIVSFAVSPVELFIGQSAVLSWEVIGANEVDLTPNLGYVPSTGTKTVNPIERTVYTLKAVNVAGTVSRSVIISVNKNIRAKDFALTEDDVWSKGLKFNMNTEPMIEGCSSTYLIVLSASPILVENSILVYEKKEFMRKVFETEKYNNRTYVTNPLLLIGDEGYIMVSSKSAEPDIPSTYSIKFLKNNVYTKLTGNIALNDLEALARIVEKRIQ